MNRGGTKTVLYVLIIVPIIVTIVGTVWIAYSFYSFFTYQTPGSASFPQSWVRLGDWQCEYDLGVHTVTGTAVNISKKYTVRNVQVRASMLTPDGSLFGQATGPIDAAELGPRDRSTFIPTIADPDHTARACNLWVHWAEYP